MVDKHFQSFYDNNNAMFVESTSRSEPYILLRFIKKKKEGSWDNPLKGEGNEIECSLEEIINIIDVLDVDSWSQVNAEVSQKIRTDLVLKWENGTEKFLIICNEYNKVLNKYQAKLLKLLFSHLLKEKIKYSTILLNYNSVNNQRPAIKIAPKTQHKEIVKKPLNRPKLVEETKTINNTKVTIKKTMKRDVKQITGIIKFETKKAILLEVSGEETWVPKSVIRSLFKSWSKNEQLFYIDSWFFEKNPIPLPS